MTTLNTETLQKADEALDRDAKQKRKKRLMILAATVLTIGTGYGTYDHFYASKFISTDNAYTAAETAQVTPSIAGIVREVRVTDTHYVHKGDVLVVLDDVDARLALAQAEAELGRAQRRVRGYIANDASLAAQLAARTADEKRAQSDLDRAIIDLDRREKLAASGSVSGDELTRARNAHESARAALAQARSNYSAAIGAREANAALIDDTTEDTNPEVTLARARRDQARVNLERTVIRAPVDGVVAKRSVQVGQQLQAGSPVLAIVPVAEVHVDANFKEGQLAQVRIGQPVEVTSDLYGSKVTYRGVVVGLSGGTGATFAAIPAQNATGNWIKVVQRVPVRIKLDPTELEAKPLQVGLSMEATIDTRSSKS
jgi:membrane fusion protein (multidrug efflux system)